jgi:hypothetical protein
VRMEIFSAPFIAITSFTLTFFFVCIMFLP